MNNLQDVIDYIFFYESSKQRAVNKLRLQKLLYFIQVDFLINFKEPCFENEMEAWDFGPVVPEAYFKYISVLPLNCIYKGEDKDLKGKGNIVEVLEACSNYTIRELADISINNIWYKIAKNRPDKKINIQYILDYYKED